MPRQAWTAAIAFLVPFSACALSQLSRVNFRTKMSMSSSPSDGYTPPKRVVIAGGGVVGTCTAYYLAKRGIASTIVDPSGEIAPAASGKAGGFLALDWNDMSPLRQLCRRSFALHQTLADDLGAESIQYRRLTCASIGADPGTSLQRRKGKNLEGVEWADGILSFQMLGNEDSIAQVHPKMLCQRLWEESKKLVQDQQQEFIQGKVTTILKDSNAGNPMGVELDDGRIIEGDAVLLACGPWTANIMTGIKYHSVIVPTETVLSQCVFFSGCGDPEVYVRPDATAYCTGFPDPPMKVKEHPGQEVVRPEAVDRILTAVRAASGSSAGAQATGALSADPTLTQACYLPSTPDGLPIMGKLPSKTVNGCDRCFVAAGHSCWGILMGPATGETMANCIASGESATEYVSLGPFEPSRFRNLEPFSLSLLTSK